MDKYPDMGEVTGLRLELGRMTDKANALEAALRKEVLAVIVDAASENARLKAEVERLHNLGIKLDGYVDLVRHENERLRKAGDAMAKTANKPITLSEFGHLAMAWKAAKEGKSV